jgi:hypothetical protein
MLNWDKGGFRAKPFKQQGSFLAHRGRFNRVYCDNHIEFEDMNRTFAPTDEYLEQWNIDLEPHGELFLKDNPL